MLEHLGTTQNVTTASLFQFLVPQLHPEGRERCKGDWQREGMLLYLLSWLQHHFKKLLLPHLTPVPQFKHQKGLGMEKNSASRLLFSHPVLNNTLLETPFPGSSNSLQLLLGSRSTSLQKTCSLCWFCQELTNCEDTSLNTQISSPTKPICSSTSSSA